VPRKKGLVLFGSWMGVRVSDNSKALWSIHKKYNKHSYFIVKDRTLVSDRVIYAYSVKGFWVQLRCDYVFYTHSHWSEFLPYLLSSRVKRVMLWHGFPIKKIGFDNMLSSESKFRSILRKIIKPYWFEKHDYIFALNNIDKIRFSSAFKTNQKNVFVTGYSRYDSYKPKKHNKGKKSILYSPTFRSEFNEYFSPLDDHIESFERLNNELIVLGADLYIEMHPVQKIRSITLKKLNSCSNIYVSKGFSINDADILVTDVSSILVDAYFLEIPVYCYLPDVTWYNQYSRETYDDINLYFPSERLEDISDLCKAIQYNEDYTARYTEIRKSLITFRDSNASRRILKTLELAYD